MRLDNLPVAEMNYIAFEDKPKVTDKPDFAIFSHKPDFAIFSLALSLSP